MVGSMARFTYKINFKMLGLLSQEKESFKKEQSRSIASYGACAQIILYFFFSTLSDFTV